MFYKIAEENRNMNEFSKDEHITYKHKGYEHKMDLVFNFMTRNRIRNGNVLNKTPSSTGYIRWLCSVDMLEKIFVFYLLC